MREAVIVSTARTPLAKSFRGAFNQTPGATLEGGATPDERTTPSRGVTADLRRGSQASGLRFGLYRARTSLQWSRFRPGVDFGLVTATR
ncbi:MAG: hypothetical protein E6I80_06020 [Chloroflexi bacterium]|nr:MAG: hypothetical protein E6I80_06020 [Chloroflexota bacterium]